MNYLSSKIIIGNGDTLVVSQSIPIGLAGFIHSNPGAKTASLQVGAANFHGKLGEGISYVADGGFTKYALAAHGRAVGDYVYVTTPNVVDGVQLVTAVADANNFTTDKAFVAGSNATIYTGQIVFKAASFTEFVLNDIVGPFAAYEVKHHAATGADTNLLWMYQ